MNSSTRKRGAERASGSLTPPWQLGEWKWADSVALVSTSEAGVALGFIMPKSELQAKKCND
jgi:hypothetical protein